MKKILLPVLFVFVCYTSNAQQSIRLDSILTFEDVTSDCPTDKRTFTYNDQGQNSLATYGKFINPEGGCEFVIAEKDSLIHNDLDQLVELYHFAGDDGNLSIRSRKSFHYDEEGNDTMTLLEVWNPFINNWRKWIRDDNVYSEGRLIESISYTWLQDSDEWTNMFRTVRNYDPVSNHLVEQTFYLSDFFTSEEWVEGKNEYFYNDQGYLIEDQYSNYVDSTLSFRPIYKRQYELDDHGNRIQNTLVRVLPDGVQMVNNRRINSYDTEIEKDHVDTPFFLESDTSKHILLQSLKEELQDNEWVFEEKNEYFYSGVTSTNDPWIAQDLNIFPNPATSKIYLGNRELSEHLGNIQIIKADGSVIFNEKLNDLHLNIEYLPTGLYNVVMKNRNSIFKGNFIKI